MFVFLSLVSFGSQQSLLCITQGKIVKPDDDEEEDDEDGDNDDEDGVGDGGGVVNEEEDNFLSYPETELTKKVLMCFA